MDERNNSGNWNSGDWNSGNLNSGNRNSGHRNSGDRNSGDLNSGDWNSGNLNSGNWNSGNLNSGDLNTTEPPLRIFNRDTDTKREDIRYPDFFYFEAPCLWVPTSAMSDEEKRENKTHETTGGYVKVISLKAGWRAAWDKASDEDRRRCLALPNWDNEVFKEISGIDVEAELDSPCEMTVAEVEAALGKRVKIVKG